MTAPTDAHLDQLRRFFAGEIVSPDHAGYDDARRVWNAVFDRRPGLIVRPTTVDDVVAAVRFGRERDLEIAVRGGGHSALGYSTSDGGLVIDLGRMNDVDVDPNRRLARTGGGALLGQLDVAGQAHGLVCPVGVVGHTGVAGLTLGGGFGRLQRHFGLTIDNLRAVELVTADGRLIRATEETEPELFWGLRGAGANFGVATALELVLHPFDGTLFRSARLHPVSEIHELWPNFRDFAVSAPDAVAAIFGIGLAEPAADYPDSIAGRPIVIISYNHSGAAEDVERDTAPLLRGPEPAVIRAGPQSYLEAQSSADLAMAWGSRSFILGGYVDDVSATALDAIVEHVGGMPGQGGVSISAQGGAIGRVADEAMAFTGRTVPFDISADLTWSDPALDAACADWIRDAMAIVAGDLLPGRYVNELSDAGAEMVRSIYGDPTMARLRALKRAWDPTNVFRLNHNIEPA
jgi:FAD/FMN-containing dehydrogenase